MTAGHSSYDDLARDRRDSAEYREGHAEAQRAFLIGQAVRERRLALGLSQTELAARAGQWVCVRTDCPFCIRGSLHRHPRRGLSGRRG